MKLIRAERARTDTLPGMSGTVSKLVGSAGRGVSGLCLQETQEIRGQTDLGGPGPGETLPGGWLCRWWQPFSEQSPGVASRLGQTLLCTAAFIFPR